MRVGLVLSDSWLARLRGYFGQFWSVFLVVFLEWVFLGDRVVKACVCD